MLLSSFIKPFFKLPNLIVKQWNACIEQWQSRELSNVQRKVPKKEKETHANTMQHKRNVFRFVLFHFSLIPQPNSSIVMLVILFFTCCCCCFCCYGHEARVCFILTLNGNINMYPFTGSEFIFIYDSQLK